MASSSNGAVSTVSNSAKAVTHGDFGFDAADLAAAQRAYVTARDAGVMVTWSGVTPTATLGHLIAQNGTIEVSGNTNINALSFIREDATDAEVSVTLES